MKKKLYMKMVFITLDNLRIIDQMEKENYIIIMEIYYMREILLMVKGKVLENILIKMVMYMKANG